MGVSVLKKDKLGNENTPQDLLVSSPCPPQKRQKVKEKEKDFFIMRRPRLLRESESGTVCHPSPGFIHPSGEMEGGCHRSLVLCPLLFPLYPHRMSLLVLMAFRLGVLSPVLCKPLSRDGVSGSTTLPHIRPWLVPAYPHQPIPLCWGLVLHVSVSVCSCCTGLGPAEP